MAARHGAMLYSGLTWRLACRKCFAPFTVPFEIETDHRSRSYATCPACGHRQKVIRLPTHEAADTVVPHGHASEFYREKSLREAEARKFERSADWETIAEIHLGMVDCPHCGEAIIVRPSKGGPSREPATAACPACAKPVRIALVRPK